MGAVLAATDAFNLFKIQAPIHSHKVPEECNKPMSN